MNQPHTGSSVPAIVSSPSVSVAVAKANPAGVSQAPDLQALIQALMRRATLAFSGGLLLAAIIGLVTWYVVPRSKYTAVATLRVATSPKRIIFDPKEAQTDYRTFQRTQLALIKDQLVLSHALAKPEIASLRTVKEQADPDSWLATELKAEFPGNSEVLQVSLSADQPEDAYKIVNSVINSYMELIVGEDRKERSHRLQTLKELWEKYQGNLSRKRKDLKLKTETIGTSDLQTLALQQQFNAEHLSLARHEKMRAHTELLKAQVELSSLESEQSPDSADRQNETDATLVNEQVEQQPEVIKQRMVVQEAARQYNAARRLAKRPGDPAVTKARAHWQTSARELEKLRAAFRPSFAAQSHAPGGNPAIKQARDQVNVWKGYEEVLTEEIRQLQAQTKTISESSFDVEKDREEFTISNEVARKVGAEVEAVEVELGAPDRIQLLSRARLPRTKDEYRKVRAGGLAAAGTFVIVLLGVSFWEFRARRVSTPDELSAGLGLRVVGALPANPRREGTSARLGGSTNQHWRSQLVESIDATRTVLLHASKSESIRTLLVTSAVQGEAKTSVACHLAASVARAGRKTLLVDCDLRRPAVHRLLDQPGGPGLCEVLRGEVPLVGAIQETLAEGLHFLPAGRCDSAVLQALAREGLHTLLDQIGDDYDFILIDSAPILPVPDTLDMAQSVDAVVLSVLRHASRLPMVSAAYDRLNSLGIRVLGVVVNGVVPNGYYSSYYSSARPPEDAVPTVEAP